MWSRSLAPLLACSFLSAQTPPKFTIIDLGVLPGFQVSQATGISSNGMVVGYSSTPGFQLVGPYANGTSQGWIYVNGVLKPMPQTGQAGIIPAGVNASGTVVGYTGTAPSTYNAFLYQNGSYSEPAGFVENAAAPSSINDAGQVLLQTNVNQEDQALAIWNNGPTTSLTLPPGAIFATGFAINAGGTVAGGVTDSFAKGHADTPGIWSSGTFSSYQAPNGGFQGFAYAVSDNGEVVGMYNIEGEAGVQAAIFANGSTTLMGSFHNYTYTEARLVNNSGWIVGYGSNTSPGAFSNNLLGQSELPGNYVPSPGLAQAYLWTGGTFYDLLSLVEDNTGWELDFPFGINDAGQIVGTGFYHGVQAAFLLTPVKEESMMVSSSANGNGPAIAPGSLASAYGTDLANMSPGSTSVPLPISFGGTTVSIQDSTGSVTQAPLIYVIPSQVNFEVPPTVAAGAAQVTVTSGDGTQSNATVEVAAEAPGVFELNSSGLAAAYVIVYHADGSNTYEPVYAVNSANAILAAPVSLGSTTDQAYLFLFGTGFDTAKAATVSIGSTKLAAAYVGPQGGYAGLDQVNVLLPHTLAGSGSVTLQLTVDGLAANAVNLTIQ